MTARSTAPVDADGVIVQALRPREDVNHHAVATSGSTARNTTAFNGTTICVYLWATEDCYIKFGDVSVTATSSDAFLPKETINVLSLGGFKQPQVQYLAALQVTTGGTLYINELL